MSTAMVPYLEFRAQARAAMEFYHGVFGGELDLVTFDDFRMPVAEGEGHLVMHARLRTPTGFVLMASDVPGERDLAPSSGFSLALVGDEEATLRAWFDALAEGGDVETPISAPAWGGLYGMLTDRFGTAWMAVVGEDD